MKKDLLEGKGIEIFNIFFEEWNSLREASIKYNPDLMSKKEKKSLSKSGFKYRCDPTVSRYFYKFKNKEWFYSEKKTKLKESKTKEGKSRKYSSTCIRYKTNLNPFFEYIERNDKISEREKVFLIFFFENQKIREFFSKQYNKNKRFYENIKDTINNLLIIPYLKYNFLKESYENLIIGKTPFFDPDLEERARDLIKKGNIYSKKLKISIEKIHYDLEKDYKKALNELNYNKEYFLPKYCNFFINLDESLIRRIMKWTLDSNYLTLLSYTIRDRINKYLDKRRYNEFYEDIETEEKLKSMDIYFWQKDSVKFFNLDDSKLHEEIINNMNQEEFKSWKEYVIKERINNYLEDIENWINLLKEIESDKSPIFSFDKKQIAKELEKLGLRILSKLTYSKWKKILRTNYDSLYNKKYI